MTRYKGDPRAITARFSSTCKKCGKVIRKGETLYYWPNTKDAFCKTCGEPEYDRFVSAAVDEDLYNGQMY